MLGVKMGERNAICSAKKLPLRAAPWRVKVKNHIMSLELRLPSYRFPLTKNDQRYKNIS